MRFFLFNILAVIFTVSSAYGSNSIRLDIEEIPYGLPQVIQKPRDVNPLAEKKVPAKQGWFGWVKSFIFGKAEPENKQVPTISPSKVLPQEEQQGWGQTAYNSVYALYNSFYKVFEDSKNQVPKKVTTMDEISDLDTVRLPTIMAEMIRCGLEYQQPSVIDRVVQIDAEKAEKYKDSTNLKLKEARRNAQAVKGWQSNWYDLSRNLPRETRLRY